MKKAKPAVKPEGGQVKIQPETEKMWKTHRAEDVLLREDGSVELIRRAETPKDYFATFDFTGLFDDIK